MANRSKKVVISARIEPRLKAALDIAAMKLEEKVVKVLEDFVEAGLSRITVKDGLQRAFSGETLLWGVAPTNSQMKFMDVFDAVWDEDEVLFKLRAGAIGADFCGEMLVRQAQVVIGSDYFRGDYDLFGDLNGYADLSGGELEKQFVNLALVRKEWHWIESYAAFMKVNDLVDLPYDYYKQMKGFGV